ncbi:MAG: hypothetical protein JWR75_1599 [Devosia sp.]|nr:hypothetical protein [Devosia sp.]
MHDDPISAPATADQATSPAPDPARPLSDAAKRALAEAAARRAEIDRKAKPFGEQQGRGGLDPARYGDWEIKGLTSDF